MEITHSIDEQEHILRAISIATLKLTLEGKSQEIMEILKTLPPDTKSALMQFAVARLKM